LLVFTHSTTDWADARGAAMRINLLAVALLPFLFVRTFARDRLRRFTPALWTRPVSPAIYALGKSLAVVVGGLVPPLAGLGVSFIVGLLDGGVSRPLTTWLGVVPLVVIATILTSLLALVFMRAIPNPVLGALLCGGMLFYATAMQQWTLLNIMNVAASTVYSSPSIGFGPDTALLDAEHLVYGAMALVAVASLVALTQVLERRHVPRPADWAVAAIALLMTLGLAAGALAHFQTVVAVRYTPLGPQPAAPIDAEIDHYQLAVSLDPDNGQLDGTATFTITPSAAHVTLLYLALNPGIAVHHVTIEGATSDLHFASRLGWTQIDLGQTPFAEGHLVTLHVSYGGALAVARDDYAQVEQGFEASRVTGGAGIPLRAYIGQGTAFLEGRGDWYPTPWTKTSALAQGLRQVVEKVHVRVPARFAVWCSMGVPSAGADGWTSVDARPGGPLPMAFLAALEAPNHLTSDLVSYRGPAPQSPEANFDTALVRQAQQIDAWIGPLSRGSGQRQGWHGVVVPFLERPVAGPGLLLIPEWTADQNGNGVTSLTATTQSTTELIRAAAEASALAWWETAVQQRPSDGRMLVYDTPPSLQAPQGRMLYDDGYDLAVGLPAAYTAAISADQTLGNGFLAHEIAAQEDAWKNHTATDMAGVLALFQLDRDIGREGMAALLRMFVSAHVQRPANLDALILAASQALGRDFRPYIAPYLVDKTDLNPQQGTTQP
jgi:hypothetical protein